VLTVNSSRAKAPYYGVLNVAAEAATHKLSPRSARDDSLGL
jgi:hypothetical protein